MYSSFDLPIYLLMVCTVSLNISNRRDDSVPYHYWRRDAGTFGSCIPIPFSLSSFVSEMLFVNYVNIIPLSIQPILLYFNETHLNGDDDVIWVQRWFIVSVISVIFILPLCLLRNMSSLSHTSGMSIHVFHHFQLIHSFNLNFIISAVSVIGLSCLAVVIIVVSVCLLGADEESQGLLDQEKSEPLSFIQIGFFEAIGTMAFAFVVCDLFAVSLMIHCDYILLIYCKLI